MKKFLFASILLVTLVPTIVLALSKKQVKCSTRPIIEL